MLQRGLISSNPLMGLSFWRSGIIAADAHSGQFLWSGVSARPWDVAADRLAACKIGAFLRFGIYNSFNVCGVGEGRKAAAKP